MIDQSCLRPGRSSSSLTPADQISRLSPDGIVCAFRLAEIVYAAIRYEDKLDDGPCLRYWLARFHFASHVYRIDDMLDEFEEEVKYSFKRSL